MKATDKPQLSKKWWASEKPDDIKGTDLDKALQAAEKALADEKRSSEEKSIDACMTALNDVCTAADRTIKKELDKKKHKDQISVLEKFESLIKGEIKRLEDAKAALEDDEEDDDEDGEEEESDDLLLQRKYLCKMIKKVLGGKELNFGFGVNKDNPSKCTFILTRKGKPERLKNMLKGEDYSKNLIAFGKAMPDPQQKKTLVFLLAEGSKDPPQLQKVGRKFLRDNKDLKFRKLKLVMPGGQILDDTEPDPEDAGQDGAPAGDNLAKELAAIESLQATWQQTLAEVTKQIESLRKAIDSQNDAALKSISAGLGKLAGEFPDLDLSKLADAAKANNRLAYDRTRSQTAKEVGDVYKMLAEGPLLSTIDENPFVPTNVHATVKSVLERVTSELHVAAG